MALFFTGMSEVMGKTIPIFRQTHVFFGNGHNRREVEQNVLFPGADESFSKLTLRFKLNCPSGGCDWWDRKGSLYILDDEKGKIEIFRFMTPYRVGATWQLDVTDLRPLFVGFKKFQVFIDTWVGPGHAQGNGWSVDASIDFREGIPVNKVVDVIPLFTSQSVVYGDPSRPAGLNTHVELNAWARRGRIWSFVTGHGQGNTENCAEFCPKVHTINFADQRIRRTIWRNDCNMTRTEGSQMGTWTLARAGWCPGDKVSPWIIDIPEEKLSSSMRIGWSPQAYNNRFRGNYNGGSNTEPYYQISSLLVLYE